MKFAVFLVLAFVATVCAQPFPHFSEEQRARLRTYNTECREKEAVTAEDFQSLWHSHFDVDKKMKCYIKCFLEKLGFFSNGAVHADFVSSKLTPLIGTDTYHSLSEKCNSIQGADHCEAAYLFYKCYKDNHASMF